MNSRPDREGTTIRRRRECAGCERRFTTYETREEQVVFVRKRDGTRVPFERDKLRKSLMTSISKRPVSPEQIEGFIHALGLELQDQFVSEISSQEIGDRVMRFLRQVDQVAYVRFASVYRDFRDVGAFVDEVSSLREAPDESPSP